MTQIEKLIDKYAGTVICILLAMVSYLFFFIPLPKKTNNILVIRLWALGESILTLPMIGQLKQLYPDAKITLLTRKRVIDIFYKNKNIDKILFFEMNSLWSLFKNFRKYDLVIDTEPFLKISAILGFFLGKRRVGFKGNIRELLYTQKVQFNDSLHATVNFLSLLNGDLPYSLSFPELPQLKYSDENKGHIDDFLRGLKLKGRLIIGISPAGIETTVSRAWQKEKFAQLCDLLIKKHKAVIIMFGSFKERIYIQQIINLMNYGGTAINGAGLVSLKDIFCLVKRCSLFIGNDGGLMHIACAQKCPTIGLFGAETPIKYGVYGSGNSNIYKKLSCSPCLIGWKGQVQECSLANKSLCMKKISVKEVYLAAKMQLTRRNNKKISHR